MFYNIHLFIYFRSIHDIVSKYMKVYADLIKYRRADKILKNHCQRLKSEENKLKLAKVCD